MEQNFRLINFHNWLWISINDLYGPKIDIQTYPSIEIIDQCLWLMIMDLHTSKNESL